jgi:hypothetical protein
MDKGSAKEKETQFVQLKEKKAAHHYCGHP